MTPAQAYLEDVRDQFRKLKKLAEGALAQASDEDLHVTLDEEANSIAIVMRHMAGNLRSRFTDFLTTDGEKPDRNRDGEFELEQPPTRSQVMADWESGWARLFATLDSLTPDDLLRDVYIRGENALRDSGARSSNDPPRLPCGSDRPARETPPLVRVEIPHDPAPPAFVVSGFRLPLTFQ